MTDENIGPNKGGIYLKAERYEELCAAEDALKSANDSFVAQVAEFARVVESVTAERDRLGSEAVGMVFAANPDGQIAVIFPIADVLEKLPGFSLASGI